MYQSSLFNAGLKSTFSENKKKNIFPYFNRYMYVQAHVRIWTLRSWYDGVDHMQRIQSLENLYTNIWTFFIVKLEIIVFSL